jgi:hypothetical protein
MRCSSTSNVKTFVLTIIFISAAAVAVCGQESRIRDPRKFDEWGDIPFTDEKARLDNAAIQLRHDRGYIIYLVISAGKTACVGEARARGIRARNYLVRKRNVKPGQIVWIDGGYQETVTTEVWIWPPTMRPPTVFPEFTLKPNQVTLQRGCRIKCRACRTSRRAQQLN